MRVCRQTIHASGPCTTWQLTSAAAAAPPPRSILSIAALQRGLYTVVATSLIGSILSNLLLVLGERQCGRQLVCGSAMAAFTCSLRVVHFAFSVCVRVARTSSTTGS